MRLQRKRMRGQNLHFEEQDEATRAKLMELEQLGFRRCPRNTVALALSGGDVKEATMRLLKLNAKQQKRQQQILAQQEPQTQASVAELRKLGFEHQPAGMLVRMLKRNEGSVAAVSAKLQKRADKFAAKLKFEQEPSTIEAIAALRAKGFDKIKTRRFARLLFKFDGDIEAVAEAIGNRRRRGRRFNNNNGNGVEADTDANAKTAALLQAKGFDVRPKRAGRLMARFNGDVETMLAHIEAKRAERQQRGTKKRRLQPWSRHSNKDEASVESDLDEATKAKMAQLKELKLDVPDKKLVRMLRKNGMDTLKVVAKLASRFQRKKRRIASAMTALSSTEDETSEEKEVADVVIENKKKKNLKDSRIGLAAMESLPEGIDHILLDGNNMLFCTGPIRKLCLSGQRQQAERALARMVEALAQRLGGAVRLTLVFDSSQQTGQSDEVPFSVLSSAPAFKTADDHLVQLMLEQPDTDATGCCLVVTADRELSFRLLETGAQIAKPGQFFKFAATLVGGQPIGMDSFVQAFVADQPSDSETDNE